MVSLLMAEYEGEAEMHMEERKKKYVETNRMKLKTYGITGWEVQQRIIDKKGLI